MLIAIMCVRNEEYHLPTFLKHLRNFVDGFVVLDDGSTDKTLEILEQEKKVLKVIKHPVTNKLDWDEAENRKELIYETYNLFKDKDNLWVLCCDPDERFEKRFLKKLNHFCNKEKPACYGLHFRELHNDKKHYRVDGIWNDKLKYILFPLQEKMNFDKIYTYRHHIAWMYEEIAHLTQLTEYNLYHLKMIKREDRIKRADLYNQLDPDKKIQPIGYDYLHDDKNMVLKKISYKTRYAYKYIPNDLKRPL